MLTLSLAHCLPLPVVFPPAICCRDCDCDCSRCCCCCYRHQTATCLLLPIYSTATTACHRRCPATAVVDRRHRPLACCRRITIVTTAADAGVTAAAAAAAASPAASLPVAAAAAAVPLATIGTPPAVCRPDIQQKARCSDSLQYQYGDPALSTPLLALCQIVLNTLHLCRPPAETPSAAAAAAAAAATPLSRIGEHVWVRCDPRRKVGSFCLGIL